MMDQAIRDFAKQFRYRPKLEGGKLKKYKKFIVAGMGGSHLAADILRTINPSLDIEVRADYGLPAMAEKDYKKTLVIASSYSGNTEETVSALEEAVAKQIPVATMSVGGKLLALAKQRNVPYIQLPDTGIQPRAALGFGLMALLKLTKQKELFKEAAGLAKTLDPKALENAGRELARKLRDRVPVIYASARNFSLAYNWKIKFNETGKIPAFYNVFPELNHNEMTGFDAQPASHHLSERFHFIFLKDSADHPQVQKRLATTANLYADRGLPVEILELSGDSQLQKLFASLLVADWAAVHTAQNYGLESEQVPMVEEFKQLIK